MANSASGGQLNTYTTLPYATSTTAATSGLVIYGVSAAGIQGGVTNSAVTTALATAANIAYQGITHFNNVAGNNGVYMGPAGAEIPLLDKQATIVTVCSVSAASVGWIVAPFNCTISGYWTQATAAVAAATANMCAVYTGSSASGGLIATIVNATGGNPGDTYAWYTATVNTVITGGTPISLNFNTTVLGTAYTQIVTAVFTRVGI